MAAALSRAEFDARGLRSGGLCLSSAAGCRGGYPRFKPSNAFESASTPQWFPLSVIRYHLDTQPVTRWYLMHNSAFATWNDTRTGLSCFQFSHCTLWGLKYCPFAIAFSTSISIQTVPVLVCARDMTRTERCPAGTKALVVAEVPYTHIIVVMLPAVGVCSIISDDYSRVLLDLLPALQSCGVPYSSIYTQQPPLVFESCYTRFCILKFLLKR